MSEARLDEPTAPEPDQSDPPNNTLSRDLTEPDAGAPAPSDPPNNT